MKNYRQNVLEATSELINAICGGDADEMLSSRAHRQNISWLIIILDYVFGEGHCKESWEWERDHYNVERFK